MAVDFSEMVKEIRNSMIAEHEKIRQELMVLRNRILSLYFQHEPKTRHWYSTYSDRDLSGNRTGSVMVEEYYGDTKNLFLVIWFDVGNWRIRIRRFNDKETMLKEMKIDTQIK